MLNIHSVLMKLKYIQSVKLAITRVPLKIVDTGVTMITLVRVHMRPLQSIKIDSNHIGCHVM